MGRREFFREKGMEANTVGGMDVDKIIVRMSQKVTRNLLLMISPKSQ